MSEAQSAIGAPPETGGAGPGAGVFPSQALAEAIERDWVSSGDYKIHPEAIQPSRKRSRGLPSSGSTCATAPCSSATAPTWCR
jgi:hypothetical protein